MVDAQRPVVRTVVIAEDEALIRLDLREMLEEEGYRVVAEAADAETAEDLVTENRPVRAVVDVKMPPLDGLSVDELTALESQVTDLQERLETRKLVDRAKGVLQDRHGLDEAAAYRWVQRTSMDRRLTMRQVAELVLAEPASDQV